MHSPVSQRASNTSCRHSPSTHESSLQDAPSSHERGTPPQVPAVHRSATVQPSWSSQVEPSCRVGFEQTPLAALQVPAHVALVERRADDRVRVPMQVPACAGVRLRAGVAVVAGACRRRRTGSSRRRSPGCTCRRAWHWSERGADDRVRSPTQVPAWQVSVWRAGVAVVARAAVGAVRVRADAGRRVARAGAGGTGRRAAQTTGLAPVQTPPGRCRSGCTRSASSHVVPSGATGASRARSSGRTSRAGGTVGRGADDRAWRPCRRPPGRCPSACTRCRRCTPAPSARARVGAEARSPRCTCPRRWHWSGAAQTTGFAPVQVPAWQVSVCVHALPSLHAVAVGPRGFEQTPVAGLHVPAPWHWSGAVQTTGFAPVQAPAWQVSVCVHALPSLHAVPFGACRVRADARRRVAGPGAVALVRRRADDRVRPGAGARLAGVGLRAGVAVAARACRSACCRVRAGAGRRVARPGVVALIGRGQTTGFAPVHAPVWHVSVCVQALPSSQACPFPLVGFEQAPVPGSHVPATWHWSSAVQVFAVPTQTRRARSGRPSCSRSRRRTTPCSP